MRHDNVEDVFALSPVQKIMLLHAVSAPISSALAHQFRYRLIGEIDVERFRRAWQLLVNRHEALRTAFLWDGLKQPVQVVKRKATFSFSYEDLSTLESSARERKVVTLQTADHSRGFDLRRAPLARVTLLRQGLEEYLLLLTRHHLVLDRWCIEYLFDELFDAYSASNLDTNQPAGRFRDYIAWIGRQDPIDAERYWRTRLSDLKRSTPLFGTRTRRTSWQVSEVPYIDELLPASLYVELKRIAAEHHISFSALLQGALAVVMSRWTGSMDVVFGLTVSGRPIDLPQVETIMGSFINNVPVRIRIKPSVSLPDWLRSIHAAQAERFPYEYVSPAEIHRWSSLPPADPLFDLLALFHSPTIETRTGPGFVLEQLAGPLESAHPFSLSFSETAGRLRLEGAYDPACVAGDKARALLVDLREILAAIPAESQRAVDALLGSQARVDVESPPAQRHDLDASPADADDAVIITQIWSETLGLERVGLDDDFFALGGTSVQAAAAFAEMERRLGYALPLSTLVTAGSIRRILQIRGKAPPRKFGLIEMQPLGRRPRLVVIPGIGGHVVGLTGLTRALGPEQPVYGLEGRGLDGIEKPADRIEDLAAQFVDDTAPVRDAPFILFGICWGALVAFELAHQLTRIGQPPRLLILMDPTLGADGSAAGPKHIPRNPASIFLKFCLDRARLYWTEWRSVSRDERRRLIREKKDLFVSMLVHRDPFRGDRSELIRQKVYWAHMQAMRRYRAQPYSGETTVLMTDIWDGSPQLDPRRAFMKYLPRDTGVQQIPGANAVEAVSRDHVGVLARGLSAEIDRVMARCEAPARE